MNNLEPGHYEREDGTRQYWDGENWLVPVEQGSQKKQTSMPKIVAGAVALVVLLAGGFWIVGAVEESNAQKQHEEMVSILKADHDTRSNQVKTFLGDAVSSCTDSSAGVDVSADFLTIRTVGRENTTGVSYEEFICVLQATGISSADLNRVETTRALDGTQNGSWSSMGGDAEIEAEWRYHPNSGASMTMKLESDYLSPFVAPEREQ